MWTAFQKVPIRFPDLHPTLGLSTSFTWAIRINPAPASLSVPFLILIPKFKGEGNFLVPIERGIRDNSKVRAQIGGCNSFHEVFFVLIFEYFDFLPSHCGLSVALNLCLSKPRHPGDQLAFACLRDKSASSLSAVGDNLFMDHGISPLIIS